MLASTHVVDRWGVAPDDAEHSCQKLLGQKHLQQILAHEGVGGQREWFWLWLPGQQAQAANMWCHQQHELFNSPRQHPGLFAAIGADDVIKAACWLLHQP